MTRQSIYALLSHTYYQSSANLSDYEIQRLENIRRNNAQLESLGIRPLSEPASAPTRRTYTRRTTSEPTRQSMRIRTEPVPTPPPEAAPTQSRPSSKRRREKLPVAAYDGSFVGCSNGARLRHQLSETKRYSDIDPALKARVFREAYAKNITSAPDEELPMDDYGKYIGVSRIQTNNGWHFRSTFGKGDYGIFCEPEMAAFVSLLGKTSGKSRELVWRELKLYDPNEAGASSTPDPEDAADPTSTNSEGYCDHCGIVTAVDDIPTMLAFGCMHPGCDVWHCWKCEGFVTEKDGDAYANYDWYCPLHRTGRKKFKRSS